MAKRTGKSKELRRYIRMLENKINLLKQKMKELQDGR